jgi:hypothetical protein
MRRRKPIRVCLLVLVAAAVSGCGPDLAPLGKPSRHELLLPGASDSTRMAVIGDSGTGQPAQYHVGLQMAAFRSRFPFDMVLMLGDNIYGDQAPPDFHSKFERPYQALLDGGVRFYAVLGNHDHIAEPQYPPFHMLGRRYYTFTDPRGRVSFYALDTNSMDREQLDWLETELRGDVSQWKMALFHHPLYSSGGRHGSSSVLSERLEPLFVKYGIHVAFSGHDHFYERIKPQQGVYYFVSGAAGKLALGDVGRTGLTARGFDLDNHFILFEITDDDLYYQAVSRTGYTLDYGLIRRQATGKS